MMIDPTRIKEILKKLSDDDIFYLWTLGQDHNYDHCFGENPIWTIEDEFWRQAGYEMRGRG